jgi:hypothetical protein
MANSGVRVRNNQIPGEDGVQRPFKIAAVRPVKA